ncbi:hypothetical protein GALL_517350 [mine drainage metagenome]|uniref:Uncharacterized protein n=1 Tax=mine drainage metagenome TaxID=410659 RepID=A0A1J5PFU5_9ZZZZ
MPHHLDLAFSVHTVTVYRLQKDRISVVRHVARLKTVQVESKGLANRSRETGGY